MLKPKFDIGQKMYAIDYYVPGNAEICSCCDGKGTIKAIIKDCLKADVCCPFCSGIGILSEPKFCLKKGYVKTIEISEDSIEYQIAFAGKSFEIRQGNLIYENEYEIPLVLSEQKINHSIKPPYIFSSLELAEEKLRLLREE